MCLDVPSYAFEHNCGGPDLQRNLKKNFFKLIIYLFKFLAVLGLHGYVQDFSSCGEQGLLFVAVCRLLIMMYLLLLLQSMGSRVCNLI